MKITIELPERVQKKLETAARVQGQSLSDFILAAVISKTMETLVTDTSIILSESEFEHMEAVLNRLPPLEENEKFQAFRKRVEDNK